MHHKRNEVCRTAVLLARPTISLMEGVWGEGENKFESREFIPANSGDVTSSCIRRARERAPFRRIRSRHASSSFNCKANQKVQKSRNEETKK